MTEKELNKLHYISKNIEQLQKELTELKERSIIKGQEITGMPFVGGTSDKTGQIAVARREIEELIEIEIKKLYIERARIERYISTIDDKELRLITRLRAINNLSWMEIGIELGMDRRTASRKYVKQFAPQCTSL